MNVQHNVKTWFQKIDLLKYYENQFQGRIAGKFKVPMSVFNKWINDYDKTPTEKHLKQDIIEQIAQVAINSILTSFTAKTILPKIPFVWLMEDTKESLRSAVCSFIQNATLNDQFWERLNASHMTSPTFSMSIDTTNWLLQSDQLDIATKNWIDKSGIADYQIIQSEINYIKNKPGNIFIIGKIDPATMIELAI